MKPARVVVVGRDISPGVRPCENSVLAQTQLKLECSMQLLVSYLETQNLEFLFQQAACMRSAWEDIHQQRRHLLVQGRAHILEPRADRVEPRLPSPEEERKSRATRPSGPPKPPSQLRVYNGPSRPRQYHQSRRRSPPPASSSNTA